MMPQPNDYYVLTHDPVPLDGSLELRIVEERPEVDYLDQVRLFAADVPAGLDLQVEMHGVGSPFVSLEDVVHTVSDTLQPPLSATHVQTGASVLTELSASDEVHAVLNDDRNVDFTYQTVELEFGDLSAAPQIKLLIDAITAFPSNAEGDARKELFGPRSKLEVADGQGGWVLIPKEVADLSIPKEFRRQYVLDLTGVFPSSTYRVRLTFLFKTYLDAVLLDTTADVAPLLSPAALESAELRWHGQSFWSGYEVKEFIYGSAQEIVWPAYPGFYTRYGDVTPLLTDVDDQYAIFWGGDEIAIRFTPPAAPSPGMRRRYLVHALGYYKDASSAGGKTVEPLPFEAMTAYPYDMLVEQYPTDPEHAAYRQDYNTRWLP